MAQIRASASQLKASTWPSRACPVTTVSQWSAETLPMIHTPAQKAPSLPTDMGKQSLEQHFHLANEQGLIGNPNPTIDQQKVKENGHMVHDVSEEDQTFDQQSENADRAENGKTQNGKRCQNIDKSDKNPEYLFVDVNEVVHYKVPLKRLPRIHRLQGCVGTLTSYCEGIENKIGLPNMGDTGMEHREYIDIFSQDNTFERNMLIEDLDYTNTEMYRIATRKRDVARSKEVVGIFVNSEGIQFVESVTDSTIFVYSDSHIEKEEDYENAIGSLMEVIIMRPLIGKIALFHRLRSITHAEGNAKDFSAASLIREFPDLYPDPSFSLQTANETTGSDVFYQSINKNKTSIERLLGEMIALSKRSNLPEEIKPVFEEYQTPIVPEEVAKDLFKLDEAITWCGFRYRTFHIYIKQTSNESEERELAKKISKFVATHGIKKYNLIYINGDLEEYSYIGSMIRPKIQKAKEAPSKAECKAQGEAKGEKRDHCATLGCFASRNCSSVCALISKHVVVHFGNEIFDKDKRLLGRVIPETGHQGDYDIAAAEIIDERLLNLDTSFRNYDGEIIRASLGEIDETMQDHAVYLRGAKTKLGVGTIEIPIFLKKGVKYHTKVQPGSYLLKKPDGRLAEEGDSGSILCYDDLDQNVRVCSMLIGKCGEEESYCFLPLSHGLEQLSQKTNDEFKLITHMENSPAQIHAVGDCLQASGSCKYLT
ncbi:uncharacterized protein LOC132757246 isoform X2 [Ruditapes philippinarum]|uniref:uncharacterized protein LOC132757246 isoform X2 n=1 Tax=Ruditapes philippinarum TaxID=129788 RepID=UPI00295BC3E6|nr:uncharacterized protein LOC132757246 isoform X2 [Ruditapes philippinarum]